MSEANQNKYIITNKWSVLVKFDPPQFFLFYHLPAACSPTTLVKYTRVSNKQIKPLLDFIKTFLRGNLYHHILQQVYNAKNKVV